MWYTSVCRAKQIFRAVCFYKLPESRKPNVYGQTALRDWVNPLTVWLDTGSDHGGRFAMKGSKVDRRRLDLIRQAVLNKNDLMRSGIYAIINTCNGHMYIGQSKRLFKRKQDHFGALLENCHANPYLQNAYNHYGQGSFRFAVIEFCLEDELDIKEQYWIELIKPEYNIKRNIFIDTHRPKNDVIPCQQGEDIARPNWHAWVYGGSKNPLLHGRKPGARTP